MKKENNGNIHKIHGKQWIEIEKQTFSIIHQNDDLVENTFKFKNDFLTNFTKTQILTH